MCHAHTTIGASALNFALHKLQTTKYSKCFIVGGVSNAEELIVSALVLLAAVTPTKAAVDEKYKQGWEDGFAYIDQATYAIFLDFGLSFVPFVEQAEKLALRYASTMSSRFSALGLDAKKYPLTSVDAVQIARIVLAIDLGAARKASPMIKAELLAYALCPWTSDPCRADVKAAIYGRRGWKV